MDNFDIDNLEQYTTDRLLEKKHELETAYDSGQIDSWLLCWTNIIDEELQRRNDKEFELNEQRASYDPRPYNPEIQDEYACPQCQHPIEECICQKLPLGEE